MCTLFLVATIFQLAPEFGACKSFARVMKRQYSIFFFSLHWPESVFPEVALLFHHEESVADLVKQLSEESADRHVKAFLHHYRWRLLALPLEEQESHFSVLFFPYFFLFFIWTRCYVQDAVCGLNSYKNLGPHQVITFISLISEIFQTTNFWGFRLKCAGLLQLLE